MSQSKEREIKTKVSVLMNEIFSSYYAELYTDEVMQVIDKFFPALTKKEIGEMLPKKKKVRKQNSQPLGMSESLIDLKHQGYNQALDDCYTLLSSKLIKESN